MKRSGRRPVDLLLLNASNYPPKAVYPYAFVQVSAVARRFGLSVARFDFVGIDRQDIPARLAKLLAQHKPRMIGLHLRQADTVVESDYRLPPEGKPSSYYLPVEDTRDLVRTIRLQTRVPIVVGGFGFTTHALRIAQLLTVDFGVLGEPDAFFERFEDVLARRSLDTIANLVYRNRGTYRANQRVFFPPSKESEYTGELIDEVLRFQRKWPSQDAASQCTPVEISRGCPCHCYFCAEPVVKGRRVQQRAWDAVEHDILELDRRGLRRVWLVCSEINLERQFAAQVARRMAALNRGRSSTRKIRWRAYNLPRMTRSELRSMLAAGFEPGWNDFASFNDRNLRRCRVPYRADEALAYCRDFHELAGQSQLESQDAKTFYLFLGNAFSDASTVSSTLRKVDEHGLAAVHSTAAIIATTRVFEIQGRYNCGNNRSVLTVGRAGRARPDIVRPTFFYPPSLLAELGSEKALREFFDYIGATFLSTRHQQERDWTAFLRRTLTPSRLRALMTSAKQCGLVESVAMDMDSDPVLVSKVERRLKGLWSRIDGPKVGQLFESRPDNAIQSFTIGALMVQLLRPNAPSFRRVLEYLGIPCDKDGFYGLSEYRVAEILYRRYRSNDELVKDVRQHFDLRAGSVDLLQLEFLLLENNIRIRPEYRRPLFG